MSYSHLTIDERLCLHISYSAGMGVRKIAKELGRSPSTISRELKRNKCKLGNGKGYYKYFPVRANNLYEERRKKCHRNSKYRLKEVEYIEEKIKEHWSPEQIMNRATDKIDKVPSTSTIYRMIHAGKIGKVEKIRMCHLRRKGKYKKPKSMQGRFDDNGQTIRKRPKKVYKREEVGHWEGDTVDSGFLGNTPKSQSCVITVVERKTRYCIAILVEDKKAKTINEAIIKALKELPKGLVKTITFDRGKEFSGFREIEKELNCTAYFCDPYCAWQKGTNENTNGLLREFYPKGTDFSQVDKTEFKDVIKLLNNRPRKCIKYKTPKEELLG